MKPSSSSSSNSDSRSPRSTDSLRRRPERSSSLRSTDGASSSSRPLPTVPANKEERPPQYLVVPPADHKVMAVSNEVVPHEEENLQNLITFVGDPHLDMETARRVLRKHGGDPQKAINAYFEGDRGGPPDLPKRPDTPSRFSVTRPGNNSPIDLTGEDEEGEMAQAIKASLEPQNVQPSENQLVLSTRAPNPDWAVVPSNAPANVPTNDIGMSQDDQSLSQAIEASLQSGYNDYLTEEYEHRPVEQQVRVDGRPVAIVSSKATFAYAGLLLQGLYFVPQVRRRVSQWRPPIPPGAVEMSPPTTGHEYSLWSLLELFATMEFVCMSEMNVDGLLEALNTASWSNPSQRVGDLSQNYFSNMASIVEQLCRQQDLDDGMEPEHHNRLFHFLHGRSEMMSDELCVVQVTAGQPPPLGPLLSDTDQYDQVPSELVPCLAAQLAQGSPQDMIFELSDVIAFQVSQGDFPGVVAKGKGGLRYSTRIFLDQFLAVNAEFVEGRRQVQKEMRQEIAELAAKRKVMTSYGDKDVLKDLRSVIYYYENVVEPTDQEHERTIEASKVKLQAILARIEKELQEIDLRITKLQEESAQLLECPELQKYPYDLRVVMIHDGLFGRKHLYNYVNDKGTWWKTVDADVEEVSEETVLNDQAGLHLGAGPYMLIYSRAMSPEEEHDLERLPWPKDVKADVMANNETFKAQFSEANAGVKMFSPRKTPSPPPPPQPPSAVPPSALGSIRREKMPAQSRDASMALD